MLSVSSLPAPARTPRISAPIPRRYFPRVRRSVPSNPRSIFPCCFMRFFNCVPLDFPVFPALEKTVSCLLFKKNVDVEHPQDGLEECKYAFYEQEHWEPYTDPRAALDCIHFMSVNQSNNTYSGEGVAEECEEGQGSEEIFVVVEANSVLSHTQWWSKPETQRSHDLQCFESAFT